MRLENRLEKWVEGGVIDSATAARIADFEKRRGGIGFMQGLFGIGAFAILLGIAAIIGANWASIPPWLKLSAHFVLLLGVAAGLAWQVQQKSRPMVTELLLGGLAGLTLTFIALVGQIYQTQEPTWKALALWLALVSPVVVGFATTRVLTQAWIGSVVVTYAMFIGERISIHGLSPLAVMLLCAALPYAMMAVGQATFLRTLRETITAHLSYTGFVLMALATSAGQLVWRVDASGLWQQKLVDNAHVTFVVCLLASVLMAVARRARLLVSQPHAVDLLLILSPAIGFLPLLIPHTAMPVLEAFVEILYWVLCGYTAAQAGYARAINLATYLIALRLVAVYIEVFGSLLQTGVGLVVSGALLIGFVVGVKRLMPYVRQLGTGERS